MFQFLFFYSILLCELVYYVLNAIYLLTLGIFELKRIELLQEKLSDLTEELHKNQERADSAELERRMVEPGIQDAEERLWRAKNELAAGEVLRDELRADKEKVGRTSIQQLCCNKPRCVSEIFISCVTRIFDSFQIIGG